MKTEYSVEVQDAIKLVCTSPASAFIRSPLAYSGMGWIHPNLDEDQNTQHRQAFNSPTQGLFANLELAVCWRSHSRRVRWHADVAIMLDTATDRIKADGYTLKALIVRCIKPRPVKGPQRG